MTKNCLTFSLDVEYESVGRLINDLRYRDGIVAINLIDEKRDLDHDQMPTKFAAKKPGQTFSAALLETLYTHGPKTRDDLSEILGHYKKSIQHFSQSLSYLRATGRATFFARTGLWNLAKSYRNHVDKRLKGDVVVANDVIALPKPVSNGSQIKSKMSGGELILKLMASKQAPVHRSEMKTAFVKDGRSKSSVGDQLFKLVKARKIKRLNPGTYELI